MSYSAFENLHVTSHHQMSRDDMLPAVTALCAVQISHCAVKSTMTAAETIVTVINLVAESVWCGGVQHRDLTTQVFG